MSKRKGGYRRKSRTLLRKSHRTAGKLPLTRFLAHYTLGDRVILQAESSHHKGLFHPRFHGKVGTIIGRKGRCYELTIYDGTKEKKLIVHPVHLLRQ